VFGLSAPIPDQTPAVSLEIVRADFTDDLIAPKQALPGIESGDYAAAGDLPLPTSTSGRYVLSDAVSATPLTAGFHTFPATFEADEPFLYNDKTVEFTISVSEMLGEFRPVDGTPITMGSDGLIGGIPSGQSLTLGWLKDQFSNRNGLVLYARNEAGEYVPTTDFGQPLATGQRILLLSLNKYYEAVVPGDVNGDGAVSLGDAATIYDYLEVPGMSLGAAQLEAADIDGSKTVDVFDFIDAVLVANGSETIGSVRGTQAAVLPIPRKKEEL
jgi:hypothetical protein